MRIRFFAITLFFFYLLGIPTSRANAQSLSLSISPPILEVFIKPGKSVTQVFKITNEGETVVVTPRLYFYDENGVKYNESLEKDEIFSLLNKDISFNKQFLLPAGSQRQIILRIHPLSDIEEKDYYRALMFSTSPLLPGESNESLISESIGSILLVTVTKTGLMEKRAKIVKFETPKIIDSFDRMTALVEVKNTGNTYFRPVGNIKIAGLFLSADFQLVPNVILPGQKRKLISENAAAANITNKTLSQAGFFLGQYRIAVDFTLDQGTTKIKQSRIIYALPWKALLFLIVLFLILAKVKNIGKNK